MASKQSSDPVSPNISRQLSNEELLKTHEGKLQIKIKRINKIIKSASMYDGYVCGRYVRNVLVPLSKQQKVTSVDDLVCLRFPNHEQFMSFLCDKNITITNVEQTARNEPEYNLNIKGSRNDGVRYQVTISPQGLTVDVDINQLIATINHENVTVFDCTDDSLTSSALIQNIVDKRVKIRSICYKEAMSNPNINYMLQRSIIKFTEQGWTVDESEKPENFKFVAGCWLVLIIKNFT